MNLKFWQWLKARTGPRETAAARAVQADVYPHQERFGIGNGWTVPEHGDYYATSVPIYSAVNIRGNSMAQVPWMVQRKQSDGTLVPAEDNHPVQQLLDKPNVWMSGADLRRITEIFLCLWGKAFWSVEESTERPGLDIWPLMPTRMAVLPGRGQREPYIKGFRYFGLAREVNYLPEEIEMFTMPNPLQDRTGLSPIAPLRLSADMGKDAIAFNRSTLRNGAIPDYVLLGKDEVGDAEIENFYRRWEERFQGPNKANRPAFATGIERLESLAFSARDMEWSEALKHTIADVSRVFGVPITMLAQLEFATLSNMEALERQYWRNAIIPQTISMAAKMTSSLLMKLGFTNLAIAYDFSAVDALNEGREERVRRENDQLDRGVITINEVRESRDLPPVPWGFEPHFRQPSQDNNQHRQADPARE